jgi:hypothetical protein
MTRLKARAAELGINELNLSDPRLIKDAPRLFEEPSRRGRKELLTPEQRALVVSVATKDKEALKAKSSKFVGVRKLPDGTVERTMDPELVALGLPLMSTSTFEGCMYEAGYVRTKDGWKKQGGSKAGKAGTSSGAGPTEEEEEDQEMADAQLQAEIEEDSLQNDLSNGPRESFHDHNIDLGLQNTRDRGDADASALGSHQIHHDPQPLHEHSKLPLDPSLEASQDGSHHPSQQEQQLRQQLQMTHAAVPSPSTVPPGTSAPAYANAETWNTAPETTNSLQFDL